MGEYLVIAELWLLFEDIFEDSFTSGSGFGNVGEGASKSGGCTGFGVVVVSVVGVWEREVPERTCSSTGFSSCCPSVDGVGGDDRVDGVSSCSLSCL